MSIIGIDLGTTSSVISHLGGDGRPEIIPNREGERTTPSVILFEDEEPIIGSIAKRSAIAEPLNVVQFVKRQMGNASWSFRTEEGEEYSPEELSAMILKRLKQDAESHLGKSVVDTVITVPAYFNDAQRKATQDAGKIAGLNVLRIINEPTAAALAYGLDRVDNLQRILVYDLGGGTFDVTVMEIGKKEIKVLATGGDKNLGGFDWDNEVMAFLNNEFQKQGGPDLLEDPILEQDLRDKAEVAKKTLSTKSQTKVVLSAEGTTASITITRDQFEDLTASLIKRTGHIMRFVMEDAGLGWKNIDKVLLVGGSTRMNAVEQLIIDDFGESPSREVNPDEIVAAGAAIQATLVQESVAAEAGQDESSERRYLPAIKIQDVTSHSLGVIAVDEHGDEFNSIILKKDTPVPCVASEVFHTVTDNQTKIHVRVTQGEDRDLAYLGHYVGESTLSIPPYPKGAPVEVYIGYDLDGTVYVKVVDLNAGKDLGEFRIDRPSNLSDDEINEKQQQISKVTIK